MAYAVYICGGVELAVWVQLNGTQCVVRSALRSKAKGKDKDSATILLLSFRFLFCLIIKYMYVAVYMI